MKNKLKQSVLIISVAIVSFFGLAPVTDIDEKVGGLLTPGRGGILTPADTSFGQLEYEFGVIDMPTERAGAASSSTGFEFGRQLYTSVTAVTIASTSTGFAVTMQESGKVRGCAFSLQTVPTTGSVGLMIQKNGTLQTTVYCRLPASLTFATNDGVDDLSTNQFFASSEEITFVVGDRIGIIASTSNLNAATHDGRAELIIQINN